MEADAETLPPQSAAGVDEGKYRFLVELGQGGTANVYLAIARKAGGFNKLVVVKVLKSSLADDPEFRDMFLNEARLAARLNHPNIVQTNEVVQDNGLSMIVMEYLEGQPLSKVLARGKGDITLPMRLRIIVEALGGLHNAHELADYDGTALGVVHRDMTPQNVFVTFDGHIKVLDFGIAKLQNSIVETRAGIIKGKVRYMAPEQISGHGVDRRADIYAVGVMLWEAAVGRRLWEGQQDVDIMKQVVRGEIPRPTERRPDVPAELERICMKALAVNKDQRYATAAELEQELEAFLQTMSDDARATKRALAKVMQTVFADVRQKTKEIVEQQLSQVAVLGAELRPSSASLFEAPSVTSTSSEVGLVRPSFSDETRPRTGRYAIWTMMATGCALLLFAFRSRFTRPAPPHEAPPAPTQAATAPAPEPVAPPKEPVRERVSVRIAATPSQTKLYMDGEQLPSNPFMRSMNADGSQHQIKAEANGYAPSTATLVLDRDTDIQLTLDKTRPQIVHVERGRVRSVSPAPEPAQPAPAPAAANKPDCSAPYFVDARGVKRYRPECL